MSLLEAAGLALPGRLQPTDLALDAGQLVCLVGPNGGGKTSLLHAIAGIGGAAGNVVIDGSDPRVQAPAQRQRLLSYLPAAREIKWPLGAADVLNLGLAPGAGAPHLEELEIGALLDRRIDRLSTGERGRVLLARALAPDPRLLLLDEPIANLDPLWQIRVMELLLSLARSGKAVLTAVHDLEAARHYADRLIVMDGGRIAADGQPEAVLRSRTVEQIFGIRYSEGRWWPLG